MSVDAGAPAMQRQRQPSLAERVSAFGEQVSLIAAGGCLVTMLVLNVVNLVVRNFTGRGVVWVWAWTAVLFVWSVFFAFHVLYRRHLDVTVDMIVQRVSPGMRSALGVLVCACGLVFTGLILVQAPEIVKRQVGEIDFVGLHRHWLSLPLLWSSAWLFVDFLRALARPGEVFEKSEDEEVPRWSL